MQISNNFFVVFLSLGIIVLAVVTKEKSKVNAQQNNTTAQTSTQTPTVEILSHKIKGGQFSVN